MFCFLVNSLTEIFLLGVCLSQALGAGFFKYLVQIASKCHPMLILCRKGTKMLSSLGLGTLLNSNAYSLVNSCPSDFMWIPQLIACFSS